MQRARRINDLFSSIMGLDLGVYSPAAYLIAGIQDLLNLSRANKEMSTCCHLSVFLTPIIGFNWTRLLQQHSIDPDELSSLLKAHHSIVAGPFALQCVTGDDCGGSEMHIYCTNSGYNQIITLFIRLGYNYFVHPHWNSPSIMREMKCMCATMVRLDHYVVLIRLCCKNSPRDALALFEGEPGVMTLQEGSSVHYWCRDYDAKPRIVFCDTVAPLCYALIK
jgi:hypothetical protein